VSESPVPDCRVEGQTIPEKCIVSTQASIVLKHALPVRISEVERLPITQGESWNDSIIQGTRLKVEGCKESSLDNVLGDIESISW
jgi:hypothetical protein